MGNNFVRLGLNDMKFIKLAVSKIIPDPKSPSEHSLHLVAGS